MFVESVPKSVLFPSAVWVLDLGRETTTQEPQGTLGNGGKEGTRTQEVGLGPDSVSYQRCHWALGVLPFDPPV